MSIKNMVEKIENELKLSIPSQVFNYPEELQQSVLEYLCQLNEDERKAYMIAKTHLLTSFNIVRSTGYCDWIKNKNKIHD